MRTQEKRSNKQKEAFTIKRDFYCSKRFVYGERDYLERKEAQMDEELSEQEQEYYADCELMYGDLGDYLEWRKKWEMD